MSQTTDLGRDTDHDYIPDVIDNDPNMPSANTTQDVDNIEIDRHSSTDDTGEIHSAKVTTHSNYEADDNGTNVNIDETNTITRDQYTGVDGSHGDVLNYERHQDMDDGRTQDVLRAHNEQVDAEGHVTIQDLTSFERADAEGNVEQRDYDYVRSVDGNVVEESHHHSGHVPPPSQTDNPFDFSDMGASTEAAVDSADAGADPFADLLAEPTFDFTAPYDVDDAFSQYDSTAYADPAYADPEPSDYADESYSEADPYAYM